jgi:hypothetical protein
VRDIAADPDQHGLVGLGQEGLNPGVEAGQVLNCRHRPHVIGQGLAGAHHCVDGGKFCGEVGGGRHPQAAGEEVAGARIRLQSSGNPVPDWPANIHRCRSHHRRGFVRWQLQAVPPL